MEISTIQLAIFLDCIFNFLTNKEDEQGLHTLNGNIHDTVSYFLRLYF